MAITIVKPGKKRFDARCTNCKCEFQYELHDVRHNYTNGRDEVSCPDCSQAINHPQRW